ncbi:MAG: 2-oxo acid dehydrogenase subunit E2 [Oscillospiraceae bacterium]|nr:2-oxo acid dehydrogenase subunit E2 [Oscillospiraceae bacterium]
MADLVLMPQLGISEETAILAEFYVKKGDQVKSGQRLFSLETGKSSFDFESEYDGYVLELLCAEGDELPIKSPVMAIGAEGETYSAPAAAAHAAEEKKEEVKAAAAPVAVVEAVAVSSREDGKIAISPRAKKLADKAGLTDFSDVVATGAEGRIIERDIIARLDRAPVAAKVEAPVAAAAPAVSGPEYTDEPISRMRKVIAENMHASLSNMAQLTLNASFDATELLNFRKAAKAGAVPGFEKVTINDLVLFAVAKTLPEFPDLNAHFLGDTMRRFNTVNLGFACDTEKGLMVPVIKNAETLKLRDLSAKAKSLAAAAQSGSLAPADMSGGSFTVSNLGSLGITSFTPVINPPQTAILGVCATETKIRLENGGPVYYQAMGLSLTFDHRAFDGAPAAKFLKALCAKLEALPLLLAL